MSKHKVKIPPLPAGFRAAGTTCGIKTSGGPDMTLLASDQPCAAAGVFTKNRCLAAPILVNRRHLRDGSAQAIIINSGNANASTGKAGVNDALVMCQRTAQHLGCNRSQVLVASTGVIGVPLPMDKVTRGIDQLADKLGRSDQHVLAAARAIMTTDLVMKTATRAYTCGRSNIRITGLCKGSGMIAPNMATMLVFILTDAKLSAAALRQSLKQATAATFNRISVDQHTSPSDAVLVLANGMAGPTRQSKFVHALTDLCRDLAEQIVRDGEGATRLMRVIVRSARSEAEADRVGRAVVDSPLVKTALHGGDPNWGRIVTAAGYSGAVVNPDRMSLTLSPSTGPGICVFTHGQPVSLTSRQRVKLERIMSGPEVWVELSLGQGRAGATWLGCDLSRQYVAINADYTT
ncbi:MAG: bifunctional glutamate N-acetyltransferase/amino-acid acetyltransferase ArgJ [Phycisphaeraceae bacterium]|nr:bifunctional glutamate N-acetyltransferase/amino-acid acetyltransferase ArgJ [Phycisphaeraceae bacterium]